MTKQPTESRLISTWTSHLRTVEAKRSFESAVFNSMSSPVWDRLIYIVEQELEEMNRATTTADYTDAAWSHKQAHRNGKRDALTGILKLLKKR